MTVMPNEAICARRVLQQSSSLGDPRYRMAAYVAFRTALPAHGLGSPKTGHRCQSGIMTTAVPCGTQQHAPTPCRPLTCRLELCATPSAVPCARSLARRIVLEWGRRDLVDTAELLVSGAGHQREPGLGGSAGAGGPAVA